MFTTRQASIMCRTCPTGGPEAEEIYQRARRYREGYGGYPRNKLKAKELFGQAIDMGNSKAALAMAEMFKYDFYGAAPEDKRFKFMHYMYEYSTKMGCPDGYIFMAEDYEKGWGVGKNTRSC